MLEGGETIPLGPTTPVSLNSTLHTQDRNARLSLVDRNGESSQRHSLYSGGERSREASPPGSPPLPPVAGEHDSFLQNQPSSMTLPGYTPRGLGQLAKDQSPPSTRLERSAGRVFLMVIFYAILSLLGWVITCILTFRPLNVKHGSWTSGVLSTNYYDPSDIADIERRIKTSENWFAAMRVMRAIAAVLTIPVTSAACAVAAAVFVQRNGKKSRMNLRQLNMLADRAWLDPAAYGRMLVNWKRYGSLFILLAIFVNFLGLMVYALQEGFISPKTIKARTVSQQIQNMLDLPDQFKSLNGPDDTGMVVGLTREALKTATMTTPWAQLWPGAGINCNYSGDDFDPIQNFCQQNTDLQSILGGWDDGLDDDYNLGTPDPFLAEMPFGFNTGVVDQQFLPRINSTASYSPMNASEWPAGCGDGGSFYTKYSNSSISGADGECNAWSVDACMPGNQADSPWKNTRDRQDFSETLYLNVTLNDCQSTFSVPINSTAAYYRVVVNTTAGYFELPNNMNGGAAGPLLDTYPTSTQTDTDGQSLKARDSGDLNSTTVGDFNSTVQLETAVNKGPLLTIAMALFGRGSFIETAFSRPETYEYAEDSNGRLANTCVDFLPMSSLMSDDDGEQQPCISPYSVGVDDMALGTTIQRWLSNFDTDPVDMSKTFSAMAYIANQNWLNSNVDIVGARSQTIYFDPGADITVPTLSKGALIGISAVMGVFFILLFGLTFYAMSTPSWTDSLDAFTMLRIGGALPERLPLQVGKHKDAIEDLDEMAGWVGDASDQTQYIGTLGVGVNTALRSNRRYHCYKGNHMDVDYRERAELKKAQEASH